jgi:branched-chain amino acid transport system permease protein
LSLQQLANGIFQGSVYALFAVGYTLIFGVLDILNLAHQAIFMLGAFIAFWLLTEAGLSIYLAFLVAMVICGVLGILLDKVAFAPLRRRRDTHFSAMITSIAAATILQAVAQGYWGSSDRRFPFGSYPDGVYIYGNVYILQLQIIILVVSLALMIGLTVMLRYAKLGKAIRAVAESQRTASLLGINVERVISQTFFISSALGGAAGVLYGLLFSFSPTVGQNLELKGLAVIILGGMGSIAGAVIGGFLLGLVEVLTISLTDSSSYRDAVAFSLLFLILLARPRGLLGRKQARQA